jgi:methylenetetrahydrofolate dehydrogenase (NADP+)/methenyltetrahydrofolate cyclohydrolase
MIGSVKLLNGTELAGFIKERQAKAVRGLKQAESISPQLAIIRTNPDPVVDSYMKLKQNYGDDIGVEVTVHTIVQSDALDTIEALNKDESVHGIIVQIPLPDPSQTEEILNSVSAAKDVDGLADGSGFDPATPMAIDWLLAGYNIALQKKEILIVGQGRLVGKPLTQLWRNSGYKVTTADQRTKEFKEKALRADVIVSATGIPGLITDHMVKTGAVIVDAGVATDKNGLVGDVDPAVRQLPDITITPDKGGVGPLTVCALFENVISSAKAEVKES